MVQALLSNPVLSIVVALVAIVLGKVLKFSGKVIKWIFLIGLAYVIVNFIGIA